MDVLHNKMMKLQAQGEVIEAKMSRGETVSMKLGLEPEYAFFENFLKGLLRGMTFANDNGACKNGLLGVVEQAFNLMEYREIYNPSNTMKFIISMNKLSDAGNTVYA